MEFVANENKMEDKNFHFDNISILFLFPIHD